MTKYSSARGTNTPFTLPCYISFLEQLLFIIHITSCQSFVLSNISQQVSISLPPSYRIWEEKQFCFFFLLEFSHHCFSALKQYCQHSVFCILGKSVLWGYRDEITESACCWPLIGLFDGEGVGNVQEQTPNSLGKFSVFSFKVNSSLCSFVDNLQSLVLADRHSDFCHLFNVQYSKTCQRRQLSTM